jgi:hypothetical protein
MPDMYTDIEKKRENNRQWMRAYRATPEGRAASKAAQRRCYETANGREVLREGKRRWKKTDKGRAALKRADKKRYVPSTRVKLSPEEVARRKKESHKRSLAKPEIQARRRHATWVLHIRKKYGLSAEQYNSLAAAGCKICGDMGNGKKLHVDHDHSSGRFRGLLCDFCNKGLGMFKDSPEKLELAARYLRETCHS